MKNDTKGMLVVAALVVLSVTGWAWMLYSQNTEEPKPKPTPKPAYTIESNGKEFRVLLHGWVMEYVPTLDSARSYIHVQDSSYKAWQEELKAWKEIQ